ncbi:unnamed protein product [Diatraea saccharalis]|uniref:Peroxidase n=1 Tax=Diatraea saccharalis TaxID=40085 RepID=A0A9N9R0V7_9NEOP|nr:unnamed protein product [Diatraea saccharalis]
MDKLYLVWSLLVVVLEARGEIFDRHSGSKIGSDLHTINRTCAIDVRPCQPHEGSRVDGTCNNYKYPSRGSARGPYLRLLKPDYGPNGNIRKDRNGKSLPSARKVRTELHSTGRVIDHVNFNAAAVTFLDFINRDISVVDGILDYLRRRQYCCEERGKLDYRCAPIHIPHDDPYLRINFQTPVLDLSTIYGEDEEALKKIRKYQYGLINEEIRMNRRVPLNETGDVCFQNTKSNGVCYKFGYKNMVASGLISEQVDYVTAYNDDAVPLVFAEYEIARRYFRTLLDGRIKKYSERHHYVGEFSYSDTLFRQELLEIDTNYEDINRGIFYQPAAKVDDIQDPDISEKFYGQLQNAADLVAADIQRGRDLGVQGYNAYRELCGLKAAKHFEDLLDVMSVEKMEFLKKLYHDIEDINLLAGIMSENLMPGTFVGPTLYCIMTKQFHLMRFSDRFWFERGDQYHSFTPELVSLSKRTLSNLPKN